MSSPKAASVCPICGRVATLAMHHIIPREFGGEEGPQIGLCAACHTSIHASASKKNGVATETFLAYLSPEGAALARKLMSSLVLAAGMNIRNDKVHLNIMIPRELNEALKLRAKDLGTTKDEVATAILIRAMVSAASLATDPFAHGGELDAGIESESTGRPSGSPSHS